MRAGLSQASVARAASIAAAQVSQIEMGHRVDPQFSTVARIAAVVGLSLDQIAAECGLGNRAGSSAQDLLPAELALAADEMRSALTATETLKAELERALRFVQASAKRKRR